MSAATPTSAAEERIRQASAHLYEALTHKFGPLDLSAHQPIVLAISEYGQRAREHDDEGMSRAAELVYEALTHRFGPLDMGAQQPLVLALAEFGEACKAAGPRA